MHIIIEEHLDKSDREFLHAAFIFLHNKLEKMANELQNLKDAQAKALTLEEMAIQLLTAQKGNLDALKQQLADAIAANDPAAIQTVADSINAESDRLNTAIAAIQPPAPPATEPAA